MNKTNFANVDLAIHIWGSLVLLFFGFVATTTAFVPPVSAPIDPAMEPFETPLFLQILFAIVLLLLIAMPGVWILVVQLNLRQSGAAIIGGIIIALSGIGLFSSIPMPGMPDPMGGPAMLLATGIGSGTFLLIGLFLLLYRQLIYRLPIPHGKTVYVRKTQTTGEAQRPTIAVDNRATKQLFARLGLFMLMLVLATVVTLVLGSFTAISAKLNPAYVFFGIAILGMHISGLIGEKLLLSLMPWAKSNDK